MVVSDIFFNEKAREFLVQQCRCLQAAVVSSVCWCEGGFRDTRDIIDTRDSGDISDTRDTRDSGDIRDTRDIREKKILVNLDEDCLEDKEHG